MLRVIDELIPEKRNAAAGVVGVTDVRTHWRLGLHRLRCLTRCNLVWMDIYAVLNPACFYPNKNQTSHRWDTQMWSRNWNGYSNPDGTWNHWSSQRSSTCIWLWIRRNSLKHIILDPDSGVTCHVTFSQLKVEQVWWRKCPELFWWQHERKVMNAFRTNVVHLLFFLLGIWTKHG